MQMKMSNRFANIERRVEKIPLFADNIFFSITKGRAVDFIKEFRRNIKGDKLATVPLIEPSIMQKIEKGYSKPDIPLYGAGEDEPSSYINMFFLQKLKNGWKARPRWAKHHTAQLQLRHLLNIHEFGVTIVVTPRMRNFLHYIGIHLRADTTAIRIPPRPVAFLSYRNVLNKMKTKDNSQRVKRALNRFIQDGTDNLLQKIFENEILIGKEFMNP